MKTFWIKLRPGAPGDLGSGTQTDPFNGCRFDDAIRAIKAAVTDPKEPVTVQILDGHFQTSGFCPGLHWTIKGRGIDVTYLELIDIRNRGFHHPENYVISTAWYDRGEPTWLETFALSDMTLDCRWPIQSARELGGEKYGGVHCQCVKGKVERVKVINWGSNGLIPAQAEAFPIYLVTYSAEDTHLTIQNCVVEQQWSYKAGYATAIMVRTCQTQQGGDRIPWRTRQSNAAVVKGNKVFGVYGMGYGCGFAENVLFLGNSAIACKAGFNCDTGPNRAVTLSLNKFKHCNQGFHVGGDGEYREFVFSGNQVILTEKWWNAFLTPPAFEYSYGIKLVGTAIGSIIEQNTFSTAYGKRSQADGTFGLGLNTAHHREGFVALARERNTFKNITDTIAIEPATNFS